QGRESGQEIHCVRSARDHRLFAAAASASARICARRASMRRRIASTCSSWVIWFGSGRLVAGVGGAFCATAGFGCTGGTGVAPGGGGGVPGSFFVNDTATTE